MLHTLNVEQLLESLAETGLALVFVFTENGRREFGIDADVRPVVGEGLDPAVFGKALIVGFDRHGQQLQVHRFSRASAALYKDIGIV